MNLGAPRLTRPCLISLHCLILRRKTKAGDNGRSAEKAPNNPNNDSFRIYRCRETPNHSAGEQEELLPVKNKQLFSLMRQAAIVSPLCSISSQLTTTPHMSDANIGLHQCRNIKTNPKTETNKYQTSKKKTTKKKLLFSASVADKDHWVIVHLRTTSWVTLEAPTLLKTWRYGGQDST